MMAPRAETEERGDEGDSAGGAGTSTDPNLLPPSAPTITENVIKANQQESNKTIMTAIQKDENIISGGSSSSSSNNNNNNNRDDSDGTETIADNSIPDPASAAASLSDSTTMASAPMVENSDHHQQEETIRTPVRRLDSLAQLSVEEAADGGGETTQASDCEPGDPHPTTPVTTSINAPSLNAFRQNTTTLKARTSTDEFEARTPTNHAASSSSSPRSKSNEEKNVIANANANANTFASPNHLSYTNGSTNTTQVIGSSSQSHNHQYYSPSRIATTGSATKPSASQTLAALFGGPHNLGSSSTTNTTPVRGGSTATATTLAAQHDYTLVGDSPYETTYDPRSPYYYNRVYGQLYITTVSVMFRGKAFGPIGAIPYERRLLLPFLEVSKVESYRTTSLKIFMNDGEQYVFKSFVNREAVVRLLKRTHRQCCGGSTHADPATLVTSNGMSSTSSEQATPNTDQGLGSGNQNENPSTEDEHEDAYETRRATTTPRSDDARKRSSSMPSSLRSSSTKTTPTPHRNSVAFQDTNGDALSSQRLCNEEAYAKTTTSRNAIPIKSLRLSLSGDSSDGGDETNQQQQQQQQQQRLSTEGSKSVAILVSPPRTTIAKRRQPQTPVVANAAMTMTRAMANGTQSQAKASNHLPSTAASAPVAAAIPSIPTVPSLNTPEPRGTKKVIALDERPGGSSVNGLPGANPVYDSLSTPHLARTPSADAAIALRNAEEDARARQLWEAARQPKRTGDWKVALEATRLTDCTLDDWFDLFFSDDAAFSLARYQLEEIGDRDVQFDSWRRKPVAEDAGNSSKNSSYNNNNLNNDDADAKDDGIPELEREIRYIHPINGTGRMMGPTEAETFRRQSLKRYRKWGAVLKNVTTVGKGVPMSDCFRVEDKWIIEQHDSIDKDGSSDNTTTVSLTLSVSFRIVFVKRTMFRGLIQKNVASETKEWFVGYSSMMERALSSEEHARAKRARLGAKPFPVANTNSSPSASASVSPLLPGSFEASPRSSSSATTTSPTASDSSKTEIELEQSTPPSPVFHSPTAKEELALGARLLPRLSPSENGLTMIGLVLVPTLAVLALLWFRMTTILSTLSAVEAQLVELQKQNAALLQQLEGLSRSSAADA